MVARRSGRILGAAGCFLVFAGLAVRVVADCSSYALPFNDLGSTTFCAEIAEAYYTGLTNGTTGTTYSPTATVTRQQMAAFITRTLDKGLSRGNRRSPLQRFWTLAPHWDIAFGTTTVTDFPDSIASDGTDVWVGATDGSIARLRGSDGFILHTWTTGQVGDCAVLPVMGTVFASAGGTLYMIDTTTTGSPVSLASANSAVALAFDGSKIWSANDEAGISIFTPAASTPWSFTTHQGSSPDPAQPPNSPTGIVWDGASMWTPDKNDGTLKKLSADGSSTVQNVDVGGDGTSPSAVAFDGTNLWVPNSTNNTLYVVRASTGAVVRSLTGNGLNAPHGIAFDGQRILVANNNSTVSLFDATSLSAIANVSTGLGVGVAASDGLNFWVALPLSKEIGRY
ncbi:MAG TPA: S-layer homology domain-containing protein [Thermoanaerobaculia bacterium]|nr:S-layer homology domain-containing protein [Thermoanaerobaculia bacterium]